jgi:predicted NBD/HSP70 family sugar kinase
MASAQGTRTVGTPRLLRAINERTVLDLIHEGGPISRAQIARESGLSKPTVSQALTALERARLVREAGRSSGGKGPSAVLYELNPRAGWVVGIDVGRSWVRGAIADLTGEFVARRDERARVRSSRTLIAQLGALANALAADAGVRWRDVSFATVGSPGVFHPELGEVALAHSLPGWGRQGIVEAVRLELGPTLAFENDVNLAALGERWKGLGKGVDDFVFLQIGTGVGAGLVLDGELYRGSTGGAGEVGYLPVAAVDARDRAGVERGALDASAGASGVVSDAQRLGMRGTLSAKRVFTEARRGDAKAKQVVEREARRIALAVVAVTAFADPELVILGGGIGANGDLLLELVEREVAATSPFRPRIETTSLGDDATLHGAVWMALQAARDRLFDRVVPA